MAEPFRFADGDTVADKVARNNPHAVRVPNPGPPYVSIWQKLNSPEAWAERDAKEAANARESREDALRRLRPLPGIDLPPKEVTPSKRAAVEELLGGLE